MELQVVVRTGVKKPQTNVTSQKWENVGVTPATDVFVRGSMAVWRRLPIKSDESPPVCLRTHQTAEK